MAKHRHFANADMRFLWGEIQALQERIDALYFSSEISSPEGRRLVEILKDLSKPGGIDLVSMPTTPVGSSDPAHEATQEVADELKPDRYIMEHKGFGRYQVTDTETDNKLHLGWLTREDAQHMLQEVQGPVATQQPLAR